MLTELNDSMSQSRTITISEERLVAAIDTHKTNNIKAKKMSFMGAY